ncbi:MAG: HAMP domain-containing histidine kinase [Flavobacteriales bacterium]|jgi:signal transduction histidine kinase|nr:HAMP domain-containing histidine kinase [Flavobacteriales bacterium]MBK9286574.1 HAMP domain-containing histidine kinase [Flavobacteriales bacterium]MBL0035061.1 HAMP domain-containing histidine kinase [Flavobacteriales bacterium]
MTRPIHRRTLLLFSVIAAYVLLQFLWWAYLLISKDNELQALLSQLQALGVTSTISHAKPERTFWMVVGEGTVFVTLLLLALWLTYRTVRHELGLARQQRNFLLAASHELRTPIAGLKLHLQTMQRRSLDPEQQATMIDHALGEVDRLGALSEKILLAMRLEEVHLPLQRSNTDLSALSTELVERARGSYGRHHRIELSAPVSLVVPTDADAYRTILGNLLENACKYAPADTLIRVLLQQATTSRQVTLEVSDQGPGVPEEDRAHLFERFFRGGHEETRQAKGTGLGLYIVHRLAAELGGEVTFSPGPSGGAIFAVVIPER